MGISSLRRLPAVGRLLADPAPGGATRLYGRDAVRVQAQREKEGRGDSLRAERRLDLRTVEPAGDEPLVAALGAARDDR